MTSKLLCVCLAVLVAGTVGSAIKAGDQFEDGFVGYIKSAENAGRTGRNSKGLWYPHASPEGGPDTIGYGHKLAPGERLSGLTDAQVDALLVDDLNAARAKARSNFATMDTACKWDALDNRQRDMLTDFAFNLGSIKGFPKFVTAVSLQDYDGMLAQYERKYRDAQGVVHSLTRRNELFRQRYLSNRADWE